MYDYKDGRPCLAIDYLHIAQLLCLLSMSLHCTFCCVVCTRIRSSFAVNENHQNSKTQTLRDLSYRRATRQVPLRQTHDPIPPPTKTQEHVSINKPRDWTVSITLVKGTIAHTCSRRIIIALLLAVDK
jgi:hypothetical protein